VLSRGSDTAVHNSASHAHEWKPPKTRAPARTREARSRAVVPTVDAGRARVATAIKALPRRPYRRTSGARRVSATAICLTGEPRRTLTHTLDTLLHLFVLRIPTPVDIFVASTDELFTEEVAGVLSSVARKIVTLTNPTAPQMRALVQRMSTSRDLVSSWQESTTTFEKHSLWGFLMQINTTGACLRAIEAHERKQGFRYAWAGRARLDSRWFAPLPKSAWRSVIGGATVVSSAGHSVAALNGVNDRFVLSSRDAFERYARLYDDLSAGRGVWRRRSAFVRPFIAERALRLQLEYAGQTINHSEAIPFCLAQLVPAVDCIWCKKVIPSAEGLSALRLAAPNGLRSAPHWPAHLADDELTDREGCLPACRLDASRGRMVANERPARLQTWIGKGRSRRLVVHPPPPPAPNVEVASMETPSGPVVRSPAFLTYRAMLHHLLRCQLSLSGGQDSTQGAEKAASLAILQQWRSRRDGWRAVLPVRQPTLGRCAIAIGGSSRGGKLPARTQEGANPPAAMGDQHKKRDAAQQRTERADKVDSLLHMDMDMEAPRGHAGGGRGPAPDAAKEYFFVEGSADHAVRWASALTLRIRTREEGGASRTATPIFSLSSAEEYESVLNAHTIELLQRKSSSSSPSRRPVESHRPISHAPPPLFVAYPGALDGPLHPEEERTHKQRADALLASLEKRFGPAWKDPISDGGWDGKGLQQHDELQAPSGPRNARARKLIRFALSACTEVHLSD
jgi:hypothetical protein